MCRHLPVQRPSRLSQCCEEATEKVSAGAPAEEQTEEDRTPAPEPTEDREDRPERKGDTKETAGATEPQSKATDKD